MAFCECLPLTSQMAKKEREIEMGVISLMDDGLVADDRFSILAIIRTGLLLTSELENIQLERYIEYQPSFAISVPMMNHSE